MARVVDYKQYDRRNRRAVLEDDLSKGMMSSEGALDEGYLKYLVNCTYEKETHAITTRPGLRLYNTILPRALAVAGSEFLDSNITIKASKQCMEDGVSYDQIILCKVDDDDPTKGTLWVLTASSLLDHTPLEFSEEYTSDVSFSAYSLSSSVQTCYMYSVGSPSIHDVYFDTDSYNRISFPVGEFAYGNSYYVLGEKTETIDNTEVTTKGLFRTHFDITQNPPRYEFEYVDPKEISVSEAVTYGYNMLLGNNAYTFTDKHTASEIQFEGILPYEVDSTHSRSKLMMTPKKNQPVDLRCYYNAPSGNTSYVVVWESRETTSSDWTQLKKETVTFSENTKLCLDNFLAQDKEIMIRVSAYPVGSQDLIKAMVVGFDFTIANYGTAKSLEQKVYDLTTATGMESWKNRVVLWGLPKDPTILFLSDYDEPSYFPYPNNIVVFDSPIIYCVSFMDNLLVFTTDKLYQVTLTDDGNSWKTDILQSHLSIDAWDKHLIQTVRNMVYFKSGNYYYMMVPKSQSTTGELVIAPITTPITSFFDRFSVNVEYIFKYTYGYTGNYSLLTYYNFLDYEDIHNIYAYSFDDTQAVVHFDVIYNTVDRTWKVWIYEAATFIYPFKQEATKTGSFITTAVVTIQDVSETPFEDKTERIIEILCWDKMLVKECYIPSDAYLIYNPGSATAYADANTMYIDSELIEASGHRLCFTSSLYARVSDHRMITQNSDDFYIGYSKYNIKSIVKNVFDTQDEYYTFKNYQFLDSGYRSDETQAKKRYREIQFQINNLDKKNMQFGMDYILDGAPRGMFYKYDVSQSIDEMDESYGVIYIDSTPYMEAELASIDLTNQWTIDQNLTPDVTLWKIRVAVSGKGYAPRIRLYSRNNKRFELFNIAWISKIMHMR